MLWLIASAFAGGSFQAGLLPKAASTLPQEVRLNKLSSVTAKLGKAGLEVVPPDNEYFPVWTVKGDLGNGCRDATVYYVQVIDFYEIRGVMVQCPDGAPESLSLGGVPLQDDENPFLAYAPSLGGLVFNQGYGAPYGVLIDGKVRVLLDGSSGFFPFEVEADRSKSWDQIAAAGASRDLAGLQAYCDDTCLSALQSMPALRGMAEPLAEWTAAARQAEADWASTDLAKLDAAYHKGEKAKERRDVLVALLSAEAEAALAAGRVGTALAYYREREDVGGKTPVAEQTVDAAAKLQGEGPVAALAAVAKVAVDVVPSLVPGDENSQYYVYSVYAEGDLRPLNGLRTQYKLSPAARGWTMTVKPAEGVVTKTGGDVIEGAEGGPNPQYARWLRSLESVESDIVGLGGTLRGVRAADKQKQFTTTHTAVAGSYVRHETSETSASINAAMARSVTKTLTENMLRNAERRRTDILAREPSMTLGKGADKTTAVEWSGARTVSWTLETPEGKSSHSETNDAKDDAGAAMLLLATDEASARSLLDTLALAKVRYMTERQMMAEAASRLDSALAKSEGKWTAEQMAEETAYLSYWLGLPATPESVRIPFDRWKGR